MRRPGSLLNPGLHQGFTVKALSTVFVFLIAILYVALLAAGFSLIRGITISILWKWFVTPVFGLPQLGVASAIGLGLVTDFMFRPFKTATDPEGLTDQEKRAAAVKVLFQPLGQCLMALFVGWIVRMFL
jgi:hypothetical protein